MSRLQSFWAIAFLLVAAGCQSQVESSDSAASHDSSVASVGGAEAAGDAHDEHAAHQDQEGEALLPIMQRLGSEMLRITHALMTDDATTVAASAEAIAAHVPISADELERIRTELGDRMREFEAIDESVHVASARLRDIARDGNAQDVVAQLNVVQAGCVSCHSQFRERLRTGTGELQPQP